VTATTTYCSCRSSRSCRSYQTRCLSPSSKRKGQYPYRGGYFTLRRRILCDVLNALVYCVGIWLRGCSQHYSWHLELSRAIMCPRVPISPIDIALGAVLGGPGIEGDRDQDSKACDPCRDAAKGLTAHTCSPICPLPVRRLPKAVGIQAQLRTSRNPWVSTEGALCRSSPGLAVADEKGGLGRTSRLRCVGWWISSASTTHLGARHDGVWSWLHGWQ